MYTAAGRAILAGMTPYPCPACGAPVDPETGCTGCHRPPDPEAAEVTELNFTIGTLSAEVERAGRAYQDAVARLNLVVARRDELARRVLARVAAPPAPVVPAAVGSWAPPPPGPANPSDRPAPPARPEASGRAVQNVLFVLGGLLLGSAAIVFAAVAWTTFGLAGRAAILAGVTLLALAVPPVARRRGLVGTAETFGALGLLLVALDGYAAWSVNLGGIRELTGPVRYTGVVCAVTAAVAIGYGIATRLVGPRFVGLALAQPVLPLVLAGTGLGTAGWATVAAAVSLADLAFVRRAPRRAGLDVAAWVAAGVAGGVAALTAVPGLVLAGHVAGAARAGAALVLVAGLVVAAAWVARGAAWLTEVAGGAVVLAIAEAGARVLADAWPGLTLPTVAGQLAVLAVLARLVPVAGWWPRRGVRVGLLVAAATPAVFALGGALSAAVRTAAAGWRAGTPDTATMVDLRLPVALALMLAVAAAVLPRRAVLPVPGAGGVLLAFALPAALPLRWWSPSIVDGVSAAVLALAAARTRIGRRAVGYGLPAVVLAGHAVAVGLAEPVTSAAVFGGLLAVAVATAALAVPRQPLVGALAGGIALLVPPALGAAVALTLGRDPRPYAAAGLVLSTIALVPLRRAAGYLPARYLPARYLPAAGLAVLLAGLGVTAATVHTGGYGALAVLCDAIAAVALLSVIRRETREWYLPLHFALGALTVVPPMLTALPSAFAVLGAPYTWLGATWSGTPAGVGLAAPRSGALLPAAHPYGVGPGAVTWALLALAAALAGYARAAAGGSPAGTRLRTAAGLAAAPGLVAILAGTAALGAHWPTVAALSLASGVAASLFVALLPAARPSPAEPSTAPRPATEGWRVPLSLLAASAAGAGLAGALATRAATLTALSAVLVTATVCGAAGRVRPARLAGWLVAVPTAASLALAAALAADVAVRWSGYWVLVAAALALATSGVLRRTRPAEAWTVESAAHAAAGVALLLTVGAARHSAGVLALWGVALGLRALWPGEPVAARRNRVATGAAAELVAYWIVLGVHGIGLLEAYTLPAAAVALLAGWLAARSRPDLHSWVAYGPALLAGLGPSLAGVLTVPGEPWRRLVLGVATTAIVAGGAVRRRQAPVVVGGGVLALLALHETVLLWDLLPRWIPLAAAGLVLVGLAVTYERRRRDLSRLRTAIGRMT